MDAYRLTTVKQPGVESCALSCKAMAKIACIAILVSIQTIISIGDLDLRSTAIILRLAGAFD